MIAYITLEAYHGAASTVNGARRSHVEHRKVNVKDVRTVVLGAGRATRMGFDKLTTPFAGEPLARRLAIALAELEPIVVTTPAVAEVLRGLPGVRVVTTLPTTGPAGTLRLANAEVRPDFALAVIPGDVPFLDAARVKAFLARVPADVDLAWPRVGGVPGHPVVWSSGARGRIAGLRADEQPNVIRKDPGLRVAVLDETDSAYVEDVDTPEAWKAAEERATRAPR
jgi:CTP:molybdopterin cytidylyltransferase MocA